MKRYGDNLPSSCMEETESQDGKVSYLAGNCAVRQDMVAFLMPADVPTVHNKDRSRNIFSLFRFGEKKIKENSL